ASPRHLGFLPLKGGGEAGVGPASIDSQSRPPHAANVDSRDQSCLPEKWRRPPPLLPLSGGGILCGSLAFYFRRTVFATTYSHLRSPCPPRGRGPRPASPSRHCDGRRCLRSA